MWELFEANEILQCTLAKLPESWSASANNVATTTTEGTPTTTRKRKDKEQQDHTRAFQDQVAGALTTIAEGAASRETSAL